MHLPSAPSPRGRRFGTIRNVRIAMLARPAASNWPWESLHYEALAWYDHWLKGRDTGILDGPPIVPNARRIAAGCRLRLVLTSSDQAKHTPTVLGFRHTPTGDASVNTVHSSSRLLLPVLRS